ncbi:MAG: OmpA family protein [Myxococcales bacterium]|nr:OmpA family protein [Myxococcales bacterium]
MRLDPHAAGPGPSFLQEDSNGWLVTFSDIVLQLFAFVVLAAVLGGGPAPTPAPPAAPMTALGSGEANRAAAAVEVSARREPDALSRARFEEAAPPPAAPVAAADLPAASGAPGAAARAASEADVAAAAWSAPATAAPVRSLATELEALVAAAGLGHAAQVAVEGGGVILSINDTIGFASGSAELLPDAGAVLDAVRELVAVRPDLVVEVSGHTDDRPLHAGPFRSNLDLSLARAARVARALAAGDPSLASRIFAAGYGDARPVAPNDDAGGRARNRRVALRLVADRAAVS